MGCCISTDKSFPSPHKTGHHSAAAAASKTSRTVTENESRDPPSSMEEETVKEVLSETPFPKTPPPKNPVPKIDVAQKTVSNKIVDEKDEFDKKVRLVSEVSALSSLSESLSITTYIDDGEEVNQRVKRSSPVTLPNRTPTRKPDQSPGRRNGVMGSVRLVQNRDMGQGMVRRGGRRDPCEDLGRRSRSPVTTRFDGGASRSVLGRTPSVRKSGKSPARAPIDSPPREEDCNVTEGKLNPHSESLENPLVSLECFIFL